MVTTGVEGVAIGGAAVGGTGVGVATGAGMGVVGTGVGVGVSTAAGAGAWVGAAVVAAAGAWPVPVDGVPDDRVGVDESLVAPRETLATNQTPPMPCPFASPGALSPANR